MLICDFGKSRLGTALEKCCTLQPRDVARGHERLPRLGLVPAAERQQTFAPQAIEFWQIKADARLVDRADGSVELSEAIGGQTGRQQYLSRQAQIISRERTDGGHLIDFGVDQTRGFGGTGTGRV